MLGVCLISNAFYHDALSSSLAATASYAVYQVVAPVGTPATPEDQLWTEPYWSVNIGATSFLKDADATGTAALVVGLFFTAASAAGAWYLIRFLDSYYRVP